MRHWARAAGLGLWLVIGGSVGCASSGEDASGEASVERRIVQLVEGRSGSRRNVNAGASDDEAADDEAANDDDGTSEDDAPSDDDVVVGALDEAADTVRADAGAPGVDTEVADAGAADAGSSGGSDAGAGDDGALHPGIEEPAAPPPPLPDDIVAESRLPFHGLVDGEEISARGVWRRLQQSRAICLGERHDNPFHHNLQRRVLERLGQLQQDEPERRGELAIGYEMFQRPFQEPLAAYVRGELSEADFLEQTQYEQRWGADLALYRPLFEANRDQGLAGLALNAPTELTRAIGRDGIESLTPELAALLPELALDDAEHREHVFRLFGLTPDDPAAASLENVYRAQVTWDETMAQTASEWLTGDDDRRLLAFAGTAHCHESAIPRRVTRRTGIEVLSATPVLESDLVAFPEDWVGYELLIVLED